MLGIEYLGDFGRGIVVTETSPAQWLGSLDAATLKSYLNRSLVPKPTSKPVLFASIATPTQAQVYAQAGFHVSAAVGWAKAAAVYFTVWNDVKAGITSMTRLKSWLAFANQLADEAKRGTVTTAAPPKPPPIDQPIITQGDGVEVTEAPPIMPPEPKTAGGGSIWPWLVGGAAVVGGAVYLKKRKKSRR